MVMGINAGPMLLAIENYRSGQIWKLTARIPEIQRGLNRIFGGGSPRDIAISLTQAVDDPPAVHLRWQPAPGVSRYNIYSSTNLADWTLRAAGFAGTTWTDEARGPQSQRFYRVKALH
jgi:hypothetical protein